MRIVLNDKRGFILKTLGKYCTEDIIIAPELQTKNITENGTYSPDDNYAGIGNLAVNVKPKLTESTIEVKTNGTFEVEYNHTTYEGLSKAIVSVDVPVHSTYLNAEKVVF